MVIGAAAALPIAMVLGVANRQHYQFLRCRRCSANQSIEPAPPRPLPLPHRTNNADSQFTLSERVGVDSREVKSLRSRKEESN